MKACMLKCHIGCTYQGYTNKIFTYGRRGGKVIGYGILFQMF